jgi:hypothetical protein
MFGATNPATETVSWTEFRLSCQLLYTKDEVFRFAFNLQEKHTPITGSTPTPVPKVMVLVRRLSTKVELLVPSISSFSYQNLVIEGRIPTEFALVYTCGTGGS